MAADLLLFAITVTGTGTGAGGGGSTFVLVFNDFAAGALAVDLGAGSRRGSRFAGALLL